MKELISRLTMKKNGESRVFKHYSDKIYLLDTIYIYVDKYGDKYEAFSPWKIWHYRRKNETFKQQEQ
jgi:hypothetical protein